MWHALTVAKRTNEDSTVVAGRRIRTQTGTSATEAAIAALHDEAKSDETKRSYRTAQRYFETWYGLRFESTPRYPFKPEVVLTFVTDHVESKVNGKLATTMPKEVDAGLVAAGVKARPGRVSLSTVMHRLAVMSKVHRLKGVGKKHRSPFDEPEVKAALSSARTATGKRGEHAKPKEALTRDLLEDMLETCEDDGLHGIRDRALLMFAFSSGGRRRSEVASADMANLKRRVQKVNAGGGKSTAVVSYTYLLNRSKTNQAGEPHENSYKPVLGVAAAAMQEWLKASGITSGPIFRGILRRRGSEQVSETALTPDAIRKMVIRRAVRAGLAGATAGKYSAHSLRSGFVTESGRQGVPMFEAMAMTEHATLAMFARYYRAGNLQESAAAKLLEDGDKSSKPTQGLNSSGRRRK